MEKLMVTGKVFGRRNRGKSPFRWSDQVLLGVRNITSMSAALVEPRGVEEPCPPWIMERGSRSSAMR